MDDIRLILPLPNPPHPPDGEGIWRILLQSRCWIGVAIFALRWFSGEGLREGWVMSVTNPVTDPRMYVCLFLFHQSNYFHIAFSFREIESRFISPNRTYIKVGTGVEK